MWPLGFGIFQSTMKRFLGGNMVSARASAVKIHPVGHGGHTFNSSMQEAKTGVSEFRPGGSAGHSGHRWKDMGSWGGTLAWTPGSEQNAHLNPCHSGAMEGCGVGRAASGAVLSVPSVTVITAWLCRYLSSLAWP